MGREIPVVVNGEAWRIRYTSKIRARKGIKLKAGQELAGLCVWRTKTIWIKQGLTREQEIETVLHEVGHAHKPDYSEKAVDQIAKEQKTILKACGLT